MTQPSHAEQRLIDGVAKGDYKILEEIYEKYSSPILKLITENNGTPHDAKDVMQEGLLVIYKKSQDVNFQLTSSFLTFFYAICKNIWWKMQRKRSNKSTEILEDALPVESSVNIERELLERERHSFYLRKMKELSAGCRQLLELFLEGKSMREITQLLNFGSEGYARRRKYKCKKQLLERVKKDSTFTQLL